MVKKKIVDFHTHILPGIDDGSKNIEQSIEMLKMLSEQGVGTVVATPHFNPYEKSVDSFLEERERAFESVAPHLNDDLPHILLGAEVYYYAGISRMDNLKELCVSGTNIIMVEMSTVRWSDYMINELIDISHSNDITLMLAHVERYIKLQKSGTLEALIENDVLIQSNASAFTSLTTSHKALKMLKNRQIDALGTDCHNLVTRKPNMGEAVQIIQKKLGKDYFDAFTEYNFGLLR